MTRAPLDVDDLRRRLGPRYPSVEVVAETASTNADLLARTGAADRTVLAAEHQTAGRGRHDRRWSSPPGAGLTVSVLVRPAVPRHRWGWLPLLTGVAVVEAVRDTGADAALKWPNDVLVADRKLAGILAQGADGIAVLGFGLNVSTTADELPVPTATSLAVEGLDVDRADLLVAVLTRLDARLAQWDDCGGDAAASGLATVYRDLCATLGRTVRVSLAEGDDLVGRAEDVDDGGHLVVATADGATTVAAGDVEHLRDDAGTR